MSQSRLQRRACRHLEDRRLSMSYRRETNIIVCSTVSFSRMGICILFITVCLFLAKVQASPFMPDEFRCFNDICSFSRLQYCDENEKRCSSCERFFQSCRTSTVEHVPVVCLGYCRWDLDKMELIRQQDEQMKTAQNNISKLAEDKGQLQRDVATYKWLAIVLIVATAGFVIVCTLYHYCVKRKRSKNETSAESTEEETDLFDTEKGSKAESISKKSFSEQNSGQNRSNEDNPDSRTEAPINEETNPFIASKDKIISNKPQYTQPDLLLNRNDLMNDQSNLQILKQFPDTDPETSKLVTSGR